MKLQPVQRPSEAFEVSISTEHPATIPGPLSLKRTDTGAFIALKDCMGMPGTPFKKYDILNASTDERARLHNAGILLF